MVCLQLWKIFSQINYRVVKGISDNIFQVNYLDKLEVMVGTFEWTI